MFQTAYDVFAQNDGGRAPFNTLLIAPSVMQKGQALKMLENLGHPSFLEPVTEGPADAPSPQCEERPGAKEKKSNYERSGKNLGHVSNALHGLDAHDLPMCLRGLLELSASCSVFNCRSSLRISMNRGYFEPSPPR